MSIMWDYNLVEWLQVNFVTPQIIHFFYILCKPIWLLLPIALLFIYLIYIDKKRALLFFTLILLSITLSETVAASIKFLVAHPRPRMALFHHINFTTFSFPSAHATNTACLLTVLYLFFALNRKWIYALGTSALLVAFGRVITTNHFFTDIIAGLLFGFICGLLSWYIYTNFIRKIFNKYIFNKI